MITKTIGFKMVGKKTGNLTDGYSVPSLSKLAVNKLLRPNKFVSTEVIDGLTVYRVDGLYLVPPKNNKNHLSWVRAGLACFKKYIKQQGKPDVIHAHNAIYAGMLAKEIKKRFGLRYIITEHSSTYALKMADEDTLKRVEEAYEQANGLFAVSESFASFLNNQFSFQRFHYLPNVLDQHLEKYQYKPVEKKNNQFVFLHIGSLIPVKDQQTLLNAFKLVVDSHNDAELWIGGSGDLEEELKQQAINLQIQQAVKFLGKLNRDEVIRCIQACDCFVLSSKYETFGVVLIEAMLFGKPVIVTRCGVGQSIVNEKIGYVTEVGNAKQLAEAMQKMIASHQNYNPEFIRNFTISNFGKEAFVKRINKIYSEVM